MTTPLRVGVVGLGRRWRKRYRPALRVLRDRYEVRALYDQAHQRAMQEARRLGCDAASGITALLESDGIDALLLLDPQWFGLWPVEQACRFGKPIFCGALPADAEVAGLLQPVRDCRLPVVVEMLPRVTAAAERLHELLANQLGPARLVLCESHGPTPPHDAGAAALVDWCTSLLAGVPAGVRADRVDAAGFASVLFDYADGRAVRLTRYAVPTPERTVRVEVVAEGGTAVAVLPNQLRWSAADGRYTHTPRGPLSAAAVLLERFYLAVREGGPATPGLEEADRALRLLRAAEQSWAEGRRVVL